MVKQPVPEKTVAPPADARARIQEAQARLKAATEQHQALVSVLSRLGVSPQEKRSAQAASKKVEHELREARRALEEAQAAARKA